VSSPGRPWPFDGSCQRQSARNDPMGKATTWKLSDGRRTAFFNRDGRLVIAGPTMSSGAAQDQQPNGAWPSAGMICNCQAESKLGKYRGGKGKQQTTFQLQQQLSSRTSSQNCFVDGLIFLQPAPATAQAQSRYVAEGTPASSAPP